MTSMMICSNTKLTGKTYDSIRLKDCTEVFQDYKKSALLFCTCYCDWKCCTDAGIDISVCQNQKITQQKEIEVSFESVLKKVNQSVTDAVIFGGLEPFMQTDEVVQCIEYLREHGVTKDIVIYTGYNLLEIENITLYRLACQNVILKVGRYKPDEPNHDVIDSVLGVKLATRNQYGVYLN